MMAEVGKFAKTEDR